MATRLYHAGHYLSIGAHYGAGAGLLTAAILLAQPWMVICAVAVVGGGQYVSARVTKRFFETKLKKHDKVHENSPRLGEIARDLYEKSGLKTQDFPIYDFVADKQKMQQGKARFLDKLMTASIERMSQMPNAGAVRLGKPVIMISTPLLKLLDDAEEKAVLAHEFAHAAARHHHVTMPLGFIMGAAGLTMTVVCVVALLSAGFTGVVAGMGAAFLAGTVATRTYAKIIGRSHLLRSTNPSLKDIADKKQAQGVGKLASLIAGVGVVSLFNPLYAAAVIATKAVHVSISLVSCHLSRHQEYQADRGAVVLGADPLALITSLRKITIVSERSVKATFGEDAPKKGMLTTAWKKATATHPPVKGRIRRLEKMAQKQNRDTATIAHAIKGNIIIDDTHLMPPDVIKAITLR